MVTLPRNEYDSMLIFGAGVAVPGARKDAIAAVTDFICANWEHIAPMQR